MFLIEISANIETNISDDIRATQIWVSVHNSYISTSDL